MELDEKKAYELIDSLMLKAKDERMKIPYSQEEGFPQCVLAIGPNFEAASFPAMWRNEQEKYHVMRVVSDVAKDTFSRAVVLVTDTRWTTNEEVQDFLGIKSISEIGLEAWQKQYRRILTEKYDGQVKNLPRQYWHEAIVVIMKGPELKGKIPMRIALYERGENDAIRWLLPKKGTEYGASHFNLLPDWWV
jgi:hypothetical protein